MAETHCWLRGLAGPRKVARVYGIDRRAAQKAGQELRLVQAALRQGNVHVPLDPRLRIPHRLAVPNEQQRCLGAGHGSPPGPQQTVTRAHRRLPICTT